MANDLNQNDDFIMQGEIVEAKCRICGVPIDVFDHTRLAKICNNCRKTVHKDCFEAAEADGEGYQCCNEPDWKPIDPYFQVHKTVDETGDNPGTFVAPNPLLYKDSDFEVINIRRLQDDVQ